MQRKVATSIRRVQMQAEHLKTTPRMKPHASTPDAICPGFVNVENLPDPAGVDLNGSPRLDLPSISSDKPEQENRNLIIANQ